MKKLSLLLVAMAVAISASAGVQFKSTHATMNPNKLVAPNTKMKKATPRFKMIDERPEGELKTYLRGGQCITYNYGLSAGEQSGRVHAIYAEDGKTVYLDNILMGYSGNGTWVEGTIEGNEIIVPLGQEISYNSYYDAYIVLRWGSTYYYEAEDSYGETQTYIGVEYDDRTTEVHFLIDGDVMYMQGAEVDPEDPYMMTGLTAQWTDDDSWSGNMDANTTLTLTENYAAHEVITEQPEGQEMLYSMTAGYFAPGFFGLNYGQETAKKTLVWGPNRTVYFQDIMLGLATGNWIMGYMDEGYNYITVPMGQYIYDNVDAEWGATINWGYFNIDEEGYVDYGINEDVTEAYFAFDAEDGTLTLLGTNQLMIDEEGYPVMPADYNGLICVYTDDNSLVEFDLGTILKEVHNVPAVPANPTADQWYDSGSEGGFSRFYFTLPTEDVDGNAIDQDNLSLSIYVDNGNGPELFTFDYGTYYYDLDNYGITTDVTEIPFYMLNGYDFHQSYIYFYRTNAEGYDPLFTENIGIQVFYTVDGVKNASDIVWLYEQQQKEKTDAPGSLKENFVYNDGEMYYNAYTVTLTETEPSKIYYRVGIMGEDGQYVYGEWMPYEGELEFTEVGTYMIEAYAIADGKTESDHIWDGFTVSKLVDVNELNADKAVASVRYFNVAGQEMAQPQGLTIMITTYTDGTTSAAKVVK